ncbi:MAG TPA: type II toxin-antitoxin system RelE/ParE family toxin [Rhizomicrobium sp.]|nr:type II toxin-antitoxin system RelE/ParE family toxin [Rhizomicrobium sp.]
MKRVVFRPRADADLELIGDYIALNVSTAPMAYPKRADLGPDFRVAVHGQYLILFRVHEYEVEIVRIVHGARDLRRALDE